MDLSKLEKMLQQAWTDETSSEQGWTEQNRALGQCAVTACVVHDYLGGEIVWAEVLLPDGKKSSHYFNKLPDGSIVDLTKRQFPEGTQIPEGQPKTKDKPTTRAYVLSFQQTANRYEILKNRVEILSK